MDDNGTPIDTPSSNLVQNLPRRQSSLNTAPPPTGFRVLVVDNDTTIRDAVVKILESFGCLVSQADDGIAAMTMLAVSQYDLVVTDFNMPFMNGYRLSNWIKREFPKTIIVIMTANCQAEIEQFVSTGVVDKWLFKPFGHDELSEVFHKFDLPINS